MAFNGNFEHTLDAKHRLTVPSKFRTQLAGPVFLVKGVDRCISVYPEKTYSALTGDGIAKLWQKILDHRKAMNASGEFAARRREQQVKWMWSMLEQRMLARLRTEASVRAKVKKIEAEVADGHLTPALGAEEIMTFLH